MAWTDLKAAVAAVIKTNGNQEITGGLLQSTLNSIIDQVGANASYKGVAIPSTAPGSPDGPVFYIASTQGTYANFGGFVLDGGFAVLSNISGSWTGTKFLKTEMDAKADHGYSGAPKTLKEVEDTLNDKFNQKGGDYSSQFKFSSGLIIATNGILHSSEELSASDYVYIKGLERLQITMIRSTATSLSHGLAFYDENKNYIKGEKSIYPVDSQGTWGWKNVIVPENAVYMRTSYYPDSETFRCIGFGFGQYIVGDMTEKISFSNVGLRVDNNTTHPTSVLVTSEYFFVDNATHLRLTMIESTASDGAVLYGVAFYDKNKNHIGYVKSKGGKPETKAVLRDVVVPEGAVFARTVYWRNIQEIGGTEFYCYAYSDILQYIDEDKFKSSKFQESYNIFDSFIYELYVRGEFQEGLAYLISSAGYSTSSGKCSIAIVSENNLGERIVVAQFVKPFDTNLDSLVMLSERNNSGISGYAIVDWNKAFTLGELFLNADVKLSDKAFNINFQPSIKESLSSPMEISFINLEPVSSVIYTAMNYIIKDEEIEGVRYLSISDDLGQTWNHIEHTFGEVTHFHIFSNGEMMFATLLNKCFHIDSTYSTVTESTVLDHDGTPFIPDAVQHFYQSDQRNYIFIVDNVEIHAWGDYSLKGTSDPNYIARVWYTRDNGRTVKCAIKFGTTVIDGQAIGVRHTHGLCFNKHNSKFYIPTGDDSNECQLIEGEYNPVGDSWEFHRLGMGQLWKFGRMYFDDLFTYLITDYTHTGAKTGILKCRTTELGDISKFQYLYTEPNGQALSSYDEDMNGNKIITPDSTGAGFIYYANGDLNFKKVQLSRNVVVAGITSVNYNGDVYTRTSGFPYQLSNRMYNFAKSIRQSGVTSYHRTRLINY